jgi:hypothetical protein
LTVLFRDASTGVVSSYAWNFGDGNTSLLKSPSHVYSTVGTYYVNLTVTGPGGSDFENKTNYITVTNVTTKIGIYKDGVWNLDLYGNGGKGAGSDLYLAWDNAAGDLPVAGDWNMDGQAETGVYRPGVGFYLKMDNGSTWTPSTDQYLAWDNAAGDRPIAGDWNMDGRAETGVYRPGVGFYLKMDNGSTWTPSSAVNTAYTFPGVAGWTPAGWTPIVGDWNGNGITKIGVYKDASWYLDYNGNGVWDSGDKECQYPTQPYTAPVVGDWDGNGNSSVGYYRWGWVFLDYYGEGKYSKSYAFFDQVPDYDHTPVVGDWNGDRKTDIGVYNIYNGDWNLDYDGNGDSDKWYNFGVGIWTPVVGDWNGDGKSKIGIYKDGAWRLDYNGDGSVIKVYSFGTTGSAPIIGDWNGDGKSKIGVYKDGTWNLDYDGNGVWDATVDKGYNIGVGTPVVGKWS